MSHLLYSSNEMYSSTELIRKSKTIFNKIINNEIDKAIILRDGKPSFMLLDFDKYEKIMAEYDILKANIHTTKNTTKNMKKDKKLKKKKKEKTTIIKQVEEPKQIEEIKDIKIQEKVKVVEKVDIVEEKKVEIKSAHIVPPKPIYEEEIIELEEPTEVIIENEEEVLKERTDDAVQKGIEVLDDLDFDDKFKQEVEAKVRERKSREIISQNIKEKKIQKDIHEEKEKEIAKKKKVQLKEFWA